MSRNPKNPSHLSTSFNTLSLYPEDSHKPLLTLMADNQRNTEQLLYFKSELLSLQHNLHKNKLDSEEQLRKAKFDLEVERDKSMELHDTNRSLSLSVEQLLLGKVEAETQIVTLKDTVERESEENKRVCERLKERSEEVYRLGKALAQLQMDYTNSEDTRLSLLSKVKEYANRLGSLETEAVETNSKLQKLSVANQLLSSQREALNQENHAIRRDLQNIRNVSIHQQYKVGILEQTLNGGLDDLKSLEDRARRQLESEVERLREVLVSCEKLLQAKETDICSMRAENKARNGALTEQIAILQQLNRELQGQNNNSNIQLEMTRIDTDNRVKEKTHEVNSLRKENQSARAEAQSMTKLYKAGREALQQLESARQTEFQSNKQEISGLEDVIRQKEEELLHLNQAVKSKFEELERAFDVKIGEQASWNKELEKKAEIQKQRYQELTEVQNKAKELIELKEREIVALRESKEKEVGVLRESGHRRVEELCTLKVEYDSLLSQKLQVEEMSKKKIQQFEEEFQLTTRRLKESQQEVSSLEQQLEYNQQQLSKERLELQNSKEKNCIFEIRIYEYELSLNEVKQQLTQTESQLQLLQQRLLQSKQAHAQKCQVSKMESESLLTELCSLKESLKCVQNYNKDLERSNTSLEKDLAQMKLKKLKASEERICQLMDQLNQSHTHISRLSSENTLLAEKIDSLYKEISSLKVEDGSFKSQEEFLRGQIDQLENKCIQFCRDLKSEQLKSARYREENIVQARQIELLESKLLAKQQIIQSLESEKSSSKLDFELQKTEVYCILNKKLKEIEGLREQLGGRFNTSRESLRRSEGTLAFSLQSDCTFQDLDKTKIKVQMRSSMDESKCRRRRGIEDIENRISNIR